MRIATWNIEWMVSLFDVRGRLLHDNEWSARYKVTRADQLDAIAHVLDAMDADAIMVVEAPDTNHKRRTVDMLELFAGRYGLRTRRAAMGYPNETQQEIAILYDPDRLTVRHDPKGQPGPRATDGVAPRFDTVNRLILGSGDQVGGLAGASAGPQAGGGIMDLRFNKPPFEIAAETAAGRAFRMIGVHMKSKAPHNGTTPEEIRRLGLAARREQIAQCLWLRERVLEHLAAGDSLMVMGDFNDGPGLDDYERLFGRSGVEIALGWDEPRATRMFDPHARAALCKKLAAAPTSARFYLDETKRFFTALLDYLMVSPDLRAMAPAWRIWHPFDDPDCYRDEALREALLTASDHFPVSIDLTF